MDQSQARTARQNRTSDTLHLARRPRWSFAMRCLFGILLALSMLAAAGADPLRVPPDERQRRIALDFPLDRAALAGKLRQRVPDATDADIDRWTGNGALQSLVIDGERRWLGSAVRNLLLLAPDAASRATAQPNEADPPLYAAHPLHARWLAEAESARKGDRSLVARIDPQRFRVTHTIEVEADTVPDGATLRIWIPFPRELPGVQDDVVLASASPPARLAPNDDLQRSAYIEARARKGQPTIASITYALTTRARIARLDPALAQPISESDQKRLADQLGERPPHIRFSPAMREWSASVVGDADNAVEIAQRLFAAVAAKPWAVAREYSTIDDLGLHALRARSADCGEKAMWLITALRLNGIPARWQSGWQVSPTDFDTMHDWLEAWLPPWGWVPLDPTHGLLASDDPAVRAFYFGGVDGYRIVFNDDWGQAFTPPKRHPRSETVDAQRGEVEWEGGNLYFDQWRYRFEWQRIPSGGDGLQRSIEPKGI
jgi:transglutaminase-like putative cysteine protease